ncbi:hypothetical protein JCM11491_001258 [Sporobolomyces phaffii]
MQRKKAQAKKAKKGRSVNDEGSGDMPPLEDMRGARSGIETAGSSRPSTPAADVSNETRVESQVEWQPGQPPARIKFVDGGLAGALNDLNLDFNSSDDCIIDRVLRKLDEAVDRSSNEAGKQDVGSILTVACSKADSANPIFKHLALRAYTLEANALLSRIHLPIPRGVKSGSPLLPETSAPLTDRDEVRLVRADNETKKLRGENDELRASLSILKADVKEGFSARDEKEAEKQELQRQLAELELETKAEIDGLKEENGKLRATSSAMPRPADKTEFVIQALSKRVKELGQQLKEKNEQLAELMIEMNKVECE